MCFISYWFPLYSALLYHIVSCRPFFFLVFYLNHPLSMFLFHLTLSLITIELPNWWHTFNLLTFCNKKLQPATALLTVSSVTLVFYLCRPQNYVWSFFCYRNTYPMESNWSVWVMNKLWLLVYTFTSWTWIEIWVTCE